MKEISSPYRYKLLIAYDGTEYGGWQLQPNRRSIQQAVQEALALIAREEIAVTGSGRTDAGVHALGQVAHFSSSRSLDCYKALASLNGLLPKDIRVLEVKSASSQFHARYSAIGKCYYYHLCLERVQLPFTRRYAWHLVEKIDLSALKEAAGYLIGTHDFTSFANEASFGSAAKNPVRELFRLDLIEEEGGLRLEFEGNGFLYKMVRNIVGTLTDVGRGKLPPGAIPEILAAKDRRKAGRAAPPEGLFLAFVTYPKEMD